MKREWPYAEWSVTESIKTRDSINEFWLAVLSKGGRIWPRKIWNCVIGFARLLNWGKLRNGHLTPARPVKSQKNWTKKIQNLKVTWASETLHWLTVRRAHQQVHHRMIKNNNGRGGLHYKPLIQQQSSIDILIYISSKLYVILTILSEIVLLHPPSRLNTLMESICIIYYILPCSIT